MITVIIPTFNSSKSLFELVCRMQNSFKKGELLEILIVDDGSTLNTWSTIQEICEEYKLVKGIRLNRNYGQHNALLCGIREANGSLIVTIDDDLQHPPEVIPQLKNQLELGYDVVYGTPKEQPHNLTRFISSKITKWALQATMGATTAAQISALRIFKTELRDAFISFDGPNANIDVLLTWATSRFSAIKVNHQTRKFGQSGYTTLKLIKHAMNMMTGFTTRPLKVATLIGFLFSLFGLVIFSYVAARWLIDGSIVPGFTFLASIIAIFSGAQLVALGIIGEYLGRMHLRSTNQPSFLISERTK